MYCWFRFIRCFMYLFLFWCCCVSECLSFFFFKQKTAYEMRISDWSSDVCSSDLCGARHRLKTPAEDRAGPERKTPPEISGGVFISAECSLIKIGRASCRERVCQYV